MRNSDNSPVKDEVIIGLSLDELHFCLTLLTRLRADDLVDEDSRRDAITFLQRRWLLAREVTRSKSSVSQQEQT